MFSSSLEEAFPHSRPIKSAFISSVHNPGVGPESFVSILQDIEALNIPMNFAQQAKGRSEDGALRRTLMQSFELSLDNWPIEGSSFRIFVCHYVCDTLSAAPRGIFALLRDIVPKLQEP